MKFNKVLCNNVLREWRFYAVDYKAMKQTLKPSKDGKPVESEEFFRLFELSKQTLQKFYHEKESWAMRYFHTMEEKVEKLKQNKVSSCPKAQAGDTESVNSSLASGTESEEEPDMVVDPGSMLLSGSTSSSFQISKYDARGHTEDNSAWLKEEYRRVGKSKHFHDFIYAKKSLDTFSRELDLFLDFLALNQTAFSNILKNSTNDLERRFEKLNLKSSA